MPSRHFLVQKYGRRNKTSQLLKSKDQYHELVKIEGLKLQLRI